MAFVPKLLAVTAGVGSCAVAAVYGVFALSVMPRLATLPAAEAVERMLHFNREAVRWPFMSLFFGTAALSACVLAQEAQASRPRPGAVLRAAGAGMYLSGFLLTVFFHVPRNKALAGLDPASAAVPAVWEKFLAEWTSGNHVRAALSAAAGCALVASVRVSASYAKTPSPSTAGRA